MVALRSFAYSQVQGKIKDYSKLKGEPVTEDNIQIIN